MEDILARIVEREFLTEAEHEKWLADARSKGFETSGPIARVVRAALTRLTTAAGI